MKTLLIIDGNALIHRAYHALPDFKRRDGVPTNAVYGFATMLLRTMTETKATHVVVCFDTPEKTFRDEMFADYRSHRPDVDDDLIVQFPIVRGFLHAAKIPYYEAPGFEADDIIATLAIQSEKAGMFTCILTGDKDILQLVNKKIFVIFPQSQGKSSFTVYSPEKVAEKFGITAEQIPDLKALAGDPSDNYKGVAGIGPKTAVTLIKEYGSVEAVYENIADITPVGVQQKLISGKESALLAKALAVLRQDVQVDCDVAEALIPEYSDSLQDFFDEYEFRSVAARYSKFLTQTKTDVDTATEKKAEAKQPHDNQLELF